MPGASVADSQWLRTLAAAQPKAGELLGKSVQEQQGQGYFHTLREICQQPSTWLQTSDRMLARTSDLRNSLEGAKALVLTGSGSSEYAGDCVRMPLQNEVGIVTEVIAGGTLLTHGNKALSPERPQLMVSLARSGDSPESVGALSFLVEKEPDIRHLVLTCNQKGQLAETFRDHPRVRVIELEDSTNDRSLVMTSSFTNLVLAARFLGMLNVPERYRALCENLSRAGRELLRRHFGTLARVGACGFRRAVYLGSGPRLGAAREAALKMLEMTAGSVATLCESYLAFRHGPMSFAHDDTLIICFLSSDPTLRAYESDLLREVDEKELGLSKLIVGESIPLQLLRKNDVAIEYLGLAEIGDENAPIIDAVAGQLLAFFSCLKEGLRPDSPSENGVINRVVPSFTLHFPQDGNDGQSH